MKQLLSLIVILCSVYISYGQSESAADDKSYYEPLKYRNIGPFRGGRSVTSSGVIGDPLTYYMGTTGGGLWKTEDAGQRWHNISDGFFKTGSVGAISVSESDPNVLYCGMGEHAPRGVMTHHGDGVYKSIDAGKTWKHIGLTNTQHISRIEIHPTNPDIVYVAAQGNLYGPNPERGIYKSTDGGETWTNVLFVDNKTGCAELSMDMNYPHILYATMWEHQRFPWLVKSGGPGSGVYKSTDAGDTWQKIEKGLPEEMGKMAIDVSRANSDKVYALIESDSNLDKGGLFVSNDAGANWKMVSGDNRLTQRAWYYIEVFADPNDEETVYVLSAPALRSIDGGKSWKRLTGTHGDFHDLWIHPENPKNLCIANDGGAAISFNYGETWSRQDNMPTAQFYRVTVDNLTPYNIYAGQQDNSSIKIASRSVGGRSIGPENWSPSAGGESAFLAFDPDNPRYVMGGSYLGTINLLDTESKASTKVMPSPIQYLGREARDMKYLYNWNAPIIKSQHEPNTFYHGAQLLLRTRDNGVTWEEASPDLTRNDDSKQGNGGGPFTNEAVGAENYGTLAYVVESQHEAGVIWTGSDDGFVQITRDNGVTWTNVTPKGLEECLINAIDISPHDPATAYIATTRYKFNDHRPGLYKTTNYGKTWTNISGNLPNNAFTRVVREDDKQKDLLITGTELGIFASWDGGSNWESLQLNLPICPITDLIIKHDNLVVATSGRSFWILDDLDVLRQKNDKTDELQFLKPLPATLSNHRSPMNNTSSSFKGTDPLTGINPANGVVLFYNLPEVEEDQDVTIEIIDAQGKLVRTISSKKDPEFSSWAGGPSAAPLLSKKKGLNRFVWDMKHTGMNGVEDTYIEANFSGHKAIPGTYSVVMKYGDKALTSEATILPNPSYAATPEDYQEYDQFMSKAEEEVIEMHDMINSMADMRASLEGILENVDDDDNAQLKKEGEALIKKMNDWDGDMIQRKAKAYDDVENFQNKFTAEYLFLINATDSAIPKVNNASKERYSDLETQWSTLKSRGDEIITKDVPKINSKLWEAGVGAVKMLKKKKVKNP